jgi:outer membrane protein assembly factor BamB
MSDDKKPVILKAFHARKAKALTALVLLMLLALPCSAHPPSQVILSYDGENQTLKVTTTHQVSNPASHYIYKIEVEKNGEKILEEEYTSQPSSSTFSYDYPLNASPGDAIKATAYCVIAGSRSAEITIGDGVLSVLQAGEKEIPAEVADYAKDWPLPNKDYENSRATNDSDINSENVANLNVDWSFPIPGISAFGAAASNPIIMGDRVYLQDLQCNVFALNLETGEPIWSKFYNVTGVVGPNGPAVGWGKVFVAKDLYNVTALDAESGEEIWSTMLSGVNTTGIDIQPVVYNGLVYVSTVPGTGDVFYAPGGIGIIYALDAETGEVVWSFSTVDSPDLWGHKEVNSGGGSWYPPAIDVSSGLSFWGIGNPAPFPGTEEWPSGTSRPGPNLYTDSIVALDHKTGNMNWFRQVLPHDLFDHDFQISPILADLTINGSEKKVVFGAGKMGMVYAFDRSSGEILWSTVVGKYDEAAQLDVLPNGTTRIYPGVLGGVETPMAYSNGVVFVPVVNMFADWTPTSTNLSALDFSNATGELLALDAATGKILWIRLFPTMALGGATVINDLVLTAEYDGTIHAFKVDSGEEVFAFKAPAGINGWPAVSGDFIIWPAGDGDMPSLVALRLGAANNASQNATGKGETGKAVTEQANLTNEASGVGAPSNATDRVEWAADGVISGGEYSKNLTLSGGRFAVYWKNDAQDLYMALAGQTDGFVAIGFEPTQAMKDADMIMGWVSDGNATVLDLYSTGAYGPHPPDEDLGGKGDILEFGGSESGNLTVIEFKRKMDTGDRFDKAFQPGQSVNIIWSMSASDAPLVRHNMRGESRIAFE